MIGKFLSCGGLGCSPTQLISGVLHSNSIFPDWLQFRDRDIIFTHQGRCAIALFCQLLHIGSGDEVIVPAYNCGTEIDPFVWAGAKVIFYRVDNRAIIDLEDVIRRMTPSTRMIYVTHYFGWPQEIRELADWCEKRGVYVLEDCALSLFSNGPESSIGRIGDAAIYSFPKSLPVPDGGALVLIKNIWEEDKNFRPSRRPDIFLKVLPLIKKWFMHSSKSWQHFKFTRELFIKSRLAKPVVHDCEIRPISLDYYFDVQKIDWSMSRLSMGILNTANSFKIIDKRRRNFQYLYNSLVNTPNLHPLFDDLPNNVCPLWFPALVKDRSRWCKALDAHGIIVPEWWAGYHRGFDWGEFPEARMLKNNLLTLPIHQDLDIYHMEYIAECVKFIGRDLPE